MNFLNPNLRDFWLDENNNLRKMREFILCGGRLSTKSNDVAGLVTFLAHNYASKYLCIRQYQANITDSVYSLIKKKINTFGYQDNFIVRANRILTKNGSEFAFYGIQRNFEEIKSFDGAHVMWIEEAHSLTKEQWRILEPTIREKNSFIIITFNPKMATDWVWEMFTTPKADRICRKINYDENPFIEQVNLNQIEYLKKTNYEEYEHHYLGVPRTDDEGSIIKRSWIEACVDADKKLDMDFGGALHVGYDVADAGGDRNCVAVFDGSHCKHLESWKANEDELVESCMRAFKFTDDKGHMSYDSIGNGAHCGSTLKDRYNAIGRYHKFNNGASVKNPDDEYAPNITNKEKFENLKAQAWQDVADRMRNTFNAVTKHYQFEPSEMISISDDIKEIEQLKNELASHHLTLSPRGLNQVEKKDKVREKLGKSPDLADAFIIGACPHLADRVFSDYGSIL